MKNNNKIESRSCWNKVPSCIPSEPLDKLLVEHKMLEQFMSNTKICLCMNKPFEASSAKQSGAHWPFLPWLFSTNACAILNCMTTVFTTFDFFCNVVLLISSNVIDGWPKKRVQWGESWEKTGVNVWPTEKALKVHLQNTQGVESHFYCILRCLRLIRNISNKFAMIFNENEFNPWPKKAYCAFWRANHTPEFSLDWKHIYIGWYKTSKLFKSCDIRSLPK